MKREITQKEKDLLNKSIDDSKESIDILKVKIEHAEFMLAKGLDMNYKDNKRRITKELSGLKGSLEFEQKLIDQYSAVLTTGEVDEEVEEELNENGGQDE